MLAIAALVPAVADAYRSGGGVPWVDFGADMRESEAALNRPGYLSLMGEWLATMPDVHEPLSAPSARVADVGCGGGWSTIGLARADPQALVDGFDVDPRSVDSRRRRSPRPMWTDASGCTVRTSARWSSRTAMTA